MLFASNLWMTVISIIQASEHPPPKNIEAIHHKWDHTDFIG